MQRIRELTGESLPGKKSGSKLKTIDETVIRHKKTVDHITSVEEVPPRYTPDVSTNPSNNSHPNVPIDF